MIMNKIITALLGITFMVVIIMAGTVICMTLATNLIGAIFAIFGVVPVASVVAGVGATILTRKLEIEI